MRSSTMVSSANRSERGDSGEKTVQIERMQPWGVPALSIMILDKQLRTPCSRGKRYGRPKIQHAVWGKEELEKKHDPLTDQPDRKIGEGTVCLWWCITDVWKRLSWALITTDVKVMGLYSFKTRCFPAVFNCLCSLTTKGAGSGDTRYVCHYCDIPVKAAVELIQLIRENGICISWWYCFLVANDCVQVVPHSLQVARL